MKKISGFIFSVLVITLILLESVSQDRTASDIERPDMGDLSGQMGVHFLDIGQGDATFIEFSNGKQMLVDCAIDARILEALGEVMPFHDRHLDYLMITHPDKDHYGGCVDVFERFDVEHIIYNGYRKEESVFWWAFWDALQAQDAIYTEVTEPFTWHIASSTLSFLYPNHSLLEDPQIPGDDVKTVDPNNGSIVFTLTYGESEFLFTADAEDKLEEYLVETYGKQLDVDVLKAGHHGSHSSSIVPFLDTVTPDHSVISSGATNPYGHPSPRVLKRLERASSTIWRTDIHGTVSVFTDGETISFSSER